jgi:iron complex outermembrane receptor protein
LLVLALAAGPAAAQDLGDLPLEDLLKVRVIHTAKFSVNADFTPSSVSVLTRADLQAYGWRTLADALRTLNGYLVTSDHTYAYLGVRGISVPGDYRSRLQLLIDGIPINENIYGSANIDSAFPLDLDLIEQIEVIRGPSASVYGGDSMAGVINVVTRSGGALQGTELSASGGSGSAGTGRASWGRQTEQGADLLLSYSGNHTRGQALAFPEIVTAGLDPVAQRVEGERGEKFFARFKTEAWRATLIHSTREATVPTGSYATLFNDTAHRESDTYTLAEIANDHKLDRENLLHSRVYVGRYVYTGDFPYDYPPYVLNRDRALGQWWGAESRLLSTAVPGHRWIAGIEYKGQRRQDQRNDDSGYGCYGVGAAPCLDDRRHGSQGSLYAQDEITVGNATYLTVGLRYDRPADLRGHWSPRLGLVHQNDAGGTFKLLYATAFGDPTVYQRYYVTPTYVLGNPELKAELMRSLDLTWEQRIGPRSRLSASAYFFHTQGLIGVVPASGLFANLPDVSGRGLELELQHRWSGGATFRGGYALQVPTIDAGTLENAPRHLAHGNLAAPVFDGQWLAGLEGQWVSHRLTGSGDSRVGGYGVGNLHLTYRPAGQGWEAALGIYNLLDRQYVDPVALDTTVGGTRDRMAQFGRSLRLKLTVRF